MVVVLVVVVVRRGGWNEFKKKKNFEPNFCFFSLEMGVGRESGFVRKEKGSSLRDVAIFADESDRFLL